MIQGRNHSRYEAPAYLLACCGASIWAFASPAPPSASWCFYTHVFLISCSMEIVYVSEICTITMMMYVINMLRLLLHPQHHHLLPQAGCPARALSSTLLSRALQRRVWNSRDVNANTFSVLKLWFACSLAVFSVLSAASQASRLSASVHCWQCQSIKMDWANCTSSFRQTDRNIGESERLLWDVFHRLKKLPCVFPWKYLLWEGGF